MHIKRIFRLVFASLLLISSAANAGLHDTWDSLLKTHVKPINNGHSTEVDYAGFNKDIDLLDEYLDTLSAVSSVNYEKWSKDKQLAFLINAYNAFTVKLILSEYPDLESIRDLGSIFSSPWKKDFVPLLGDVISLDDVEHGTIREKGVFDEPRIHFAVNCASIGCPSLRTEAYTADLLDSQLQEQTILFLSDRTRNYPDGKNLHLSSIFKWYKEDFSVDFYLQFAQALDLDENQISLLKSDRLRFRYLSYDWGLNDVQ